MENVEFYYDKASKLYDYDSSINLDYYFDYEINNKNDYYLTNKTRYITNISYYIYDNNISYKEYNIDDGTLLIANDEEILLIPIGKNIYLLAAYKASKKTILNLVYQFMNKYQCVIDVSKFKTIFKNKTFIINTYKKRLSSNK